MINNEQAINIDKIKVRLNIPLVASYLSAGYNYTQIAKACNVARQAVSHYVKRNYDLLAPLTCQDDKLIAMKSKYIANHAIDKIDNILTLDEFTKKDLISLNVVAGTHIDKYRLLSDKSTSNISIDAVNTNLEDIRIRKAAIEARLQAVTTTK